MKITTIKIILFISAGIGAGFSFWYLIDHQLYYPQLTEMANTAVLINHGLFFVSLILLIYGFFMKAGHYIFLGTLLVLLGLGYLTLMLSFADANYLYLFPTAFYLITGFIILANRK